LCIAAWPYLRPDLIIDARFLLGQYVGKLFMTCAYDTEQQLLSLAFAMVVDEKSAANWVGLCSGYVKRLSVLVKLPYFISTSGYKGNF
jgi:hypothetical protein